MENRYVKAKIRATGEILDVFRPIYESRFYRKDDPLMSYDYKELEFLNDGIDWEQRRFELVKAAMQGVLNAISVERFTIRIKPSVVAEAAIEYADAVLAEYRQGSCDTITVSKQEYERLKHIEVSATEVIARNQAERTNELIRKSFEQL